MKQNKSVFIVMILSIIAAFIFAIWSYYERVETINYFIASEIVFLLLISLLLFFYYQYKRDNFVLLIFYIVLLESSELSALNFKDIPFADLLFNIIAVILFTINLALKFAFIFLLMAKVRKARKESASLD